MRENKPFPENVHVINHPLVQHKLTTLRNKHTSTMEFRSIAAEIGLILAYEATRDLALQSVSIETPLELTEGQVLAGRKTCIISILRAGNGLLQGVLQLLPAAKVGYVGMERDEETHRPRAYYCKLPKAMQERTTLVVDPMLATGFSAIESIRQAKSLGAQDVRFLCLLATPEGIAAMHEALPEVPIYTAAIDRGLDENAYIRPGLGDAGDRLYGTL
ncbi:uracil phosphoribosyltransferase [Suttonella indologenes]|uniref:Uracil phosphoribosyltransferase n=1 Tax=Suttonella indologenes TaxID=13276 RepID=A0A380N0D6_9GAMM|nr:uracil phosphoribosyltransferase [Suttonella indologenes]SUO98270.1 Uracil phosphoribosyltransferase [Suttonella indologenes]